MSDKQNKPTIEDATRCIDLRCQAKKGIRLHPEDSAFCQKMFIKYPKWYEDTEDDVFNRTVPFGSYIRKGGRR